MTVLEGITINHIPLINDIKYAILNNDPLEEKLNVIIVVSNPCNFKRRIILAKEFIARMEFESNVNLYIVELAYNNEPYYLTESDNSKHLQLRCKTLLWHKENMINLGIKKLLPSNWKACAWIDADVEFDSPTWALDTLKVLNGSKDIVQVFSHCIDMNYNEYAMRIFQSFGFQYSKNLKYTSSGLNYFHSGYGWAITRKAYEKIGGLYEYGILGSGDFNMALCLIGQAINSVNRGESSEYKKSVLDYETKVKGLRIGYIPGIIRHYFHGSKKDRGYDSRWKILIKYNYNPNIHIKKNEDGLIIPSNKCPKEIITEIKQYFFSRNEDLIA
jgi:hypothetical protein